jgi:hypothetical protein
VPADANLTAQAWFAGIGGDEDFKLLFLHI